MRIYWILLLFTIVAMASSYVIWPVLHPYMGAVKFALITFKQFCHAHPLLGYVIYALALVAIFLLGLPFAMVMMLLAGITYDFWEATMLVTGCRLLVAIAAFLFVRHMMIESRLPTPAVIKRFQHHPNIGLLLARLSPLPDTTVNVAMGTSSIDCMHYAIISLIGMIPLTLFCIWLGNELGSITQMMKVLS